MVNGVRAVLYGCAEEAESALGKPNGITHVSRVTQHNIPVVTKPISVSNTPEEAVAVTPDPSQTAVHLTKLRNLLDKHAAAVLVLCNIDTAGTEQQLCCDQELCPIH